MKIFITGGTGFIGSYIARELISEGDEVIAYDANLNFVSPENSNYEEALELRLKGIKKDMTIIKGDVKDKEKLMTSLKEHKPEVMIHLAAIPIAKKANDSPQETKEINLDGTINVLECFRELTDLKRFIYTSTSFVYGDFKYNPADEERPTTPIDIYGETKLAGEILTKAYSNKFGIEYTIIRPSAVYGPGDANRRVSQLFIQNALKGERLKLFNGGIEKIDFTYVTDTAHGFVLVAKSEKAKNQTFNITAGHGRSVKEFAEIVEKYIPNTEIIETPTDMQRPQRGTISIKKAKKLLGYSPKFEIEEGIPKYIEALKKNTL